MIRIIVLTLLAFPFSSRAQWRWAFANKMSWAKEWAHKTKQGFKKMPLHKKSKKKS